MADNKNPQTIGPEFAGPRLQSGCRESADPENQQILSKTRPYRSSVTVNILGAEYPIKGDADPEYIREVARYVDDKMKEVTSNTSVSSITKVAILTALNLTDELFRERAKNQTLISEIDEKAIRLIKLLDKEISG